MKVSFLTLCGVSAESFMSEPLSDGPVLALISRLLKKLCEGHGKLRVVTEEVRINSGRTVWVALLPGTRES